MKIKKTLRYFSTFALAGLLTISLVVVHTQPAFAVQPSENRFLTCAIHNVTSFYASEAWWENEYNSSNEIAEGLEAAFSYWTSIPDEILLQGDEALAEWQKAHPSPQTRASVIGCVGAIAWLIGSNVVGAAKIFKIKKYINALGGVAKAVELMWKASFKWEKIKAAGGALAGLGAELLGITEVRDQCFS